MGPAVLSAIISQYGHVVAIIRHDETVGASNQSYEEDNARQDHLLENWTPSSWVQH